MRLYNVISVRALVAFNTEIGSQLHLLELLRVD